MHGRRVRQVFLALTLAAAVPAVMAAPAQSVTSFQTTYRAYNLWDQWKWWQPDKCTETQTVYVSEPETAGRYPVFVYLHGSLADWFGNGEGRRVVELAAAQGFVAATFSYDSWVGGSGATALNGQARCMFSADSPGNALAQLCANPAADCSRGISVSGFSQGGDIALLARNVDPRVSAAWVMGVVTARPFLLAPPLGSRALADDRVRIDDGQADLQHSGASGPDLSQINELTGMACSTSPCLRADGSGYYMVGHPEVADGYADHCYWMSEHSLNPYWSCSTNPTFDPGFRPPSTTPWSLITDLDWLRGKLGSPSVRLRPHRGGHGRPPAADAGA